MLATAAINPARLTFERRHLALIGDKNARFSARERSLRGIIDGTIALGSLKPEEVRQVLTDLVNTEPQFKALAEQALAKLIAAPAAPAAPAPAAPPAAPLTLQEQLAAVGKNIEGLVAGLVDRRQTLTRGLDQLNVEKRRGALEKDLEQTNLSLKGAEGSAKAQWDLYEMQRRQILETAQKPQENLPTAEEIGKQLKEIEEKRDNDPLIRNTLGRIGQLEGILAGIEKDLSDLTTQEEALKVATGKAGTEAGQLFNDIQGFMGELREQIGPLSGILPRVAPGAPPEKK